MNRYTSVLVILLIFLNGCTKNHSNVSTEKGKESEIIMNINIDEQDNNGRTPLLNAVIENNIDEAKRLIDQGANVNIKDNISDTPYLYAGANGRLEILMYMVENSTIDYSIRNRFGGNTLIPAAEKGHSSTVKYLLEVGKEPIDLQNNFGYTALIEAVALGNGGEGQKEIVQFLLEYHADTSIKDNNGMTALDYARNKGYVEIEELLAP